MGDVGESVCVTSLLSHKISIPIRPLPTTHHRLFDHFRYINHAPTKEIMPKAINIGSTEAPHDRVLSPPQLEVGELPPGLNDWAISKPPSPVSSNMCSRFERATFLSLPILSLPHRNLSASCFILVAKKDKSRIGRDGRPFSVLSMTCTSAAYILSSKLAKRGVVAETLGVAKPLSRQKPL